MVQLAPSYWHLLHIWVFSQSCYLPVSVSLSFVRSFLPACLPACYPFFLHPVNHSVLFLMLCGGTRTLYTIATNTPKPRCLLVYVCRSTEAAAAANNVKPIQPLDFQRTALRPGPRFPKYQITDKVPRAGSPDWKRVVAVVVQVSSHSTIFVLFLQSSLILHSELCNQHSTKLLRGFVLKSESRNGIFATVFTA